MKRAFFSNPVCFTLSTIILFFMSSCGKDGQMNEKSAAINQNVNGTSTCQPSVYKLFGGQTIEMGNLTVWNDADKLYVRYSTTTDYKMEKLHLWVGLDPANVPQTSNGTPIPGQFTYKYEPATGFNEYTFTIPLGDICIGSTDYCNAKLYIYAHGETATETIWSFGTEFAYTGDKVNPNTSRWGWYSTYTVCCQSSDPADPVYISETAFAKFTKTDGGYVFTTGKQSNPENYPTLNLSNNQWGWAGNLAIPGSYTADVWAGAAQNNTSKGVKVGTFTASITGSDLTVTYTLLSGYTMSEFHLYADTAPPTTLAPGQYGNIVTFDPKVSTYTATFPIAHYTAENKFWIIAHSVVQIPVP
jgi:hypothetical protein